ncbi:MAG: SDR family NAD(P)-dependent oxidoreductase, partial [Bdellovibrio sp.]
MLQTHMTNYPDLNKKVALITGAGSGIGKATALRLAQAGASLILSDLQEGPVQELAVQIRSSGQKAVALRADVSREEDAKAQVDLALNEFGSLHIAFNNAGIGGELHATADYPVSAWNQVVAVNLTGVFLGMKTQIPALLKSGGGSIINNSSILGSVAFAG